MTAAACAVVMARCRELISHQGLPGTKGEPHRLLELIDEQGARTFVQLKNIGTGGGAWATLALR